MIPTVYDADQLRHDPSGGVWVGVPIPGDELPERVTLIVEALAEQGSAVSAPSDLPVESWPLVHDPLLIDYLATAYEGWHRSDYVRDPGQRQVVPYVFPGVTGVPYRKRSPSVGARAGEFAMDTMTLVGEGSWEAIAAAVRCSVTAADRVAGGERGVYAACRPPGHHAGPAYFGGSCYLNNAAFAAQRLRDKGVGVVAVIDVDAHHGNGTQDIFYERADIRYTSAHVDPGAGWFPHFVGYADEAGAGAGFGHNLNLPLAPGTGDRGWLGAVSAMCEFAAVESQAIVVSLGVDAAMDDPESPLEVSLAGYRAAGRMVGELGRPTVMVQEGGYHLPSLGHLVAGFLAGFEEGAST